jgi:peptide methionine sulfoxide reductase MsrB
MRLMRNVPFTLRVIGVVVVTVALVAIMYFFWGATTQAAPPQPMPFPHQRMVQAGVQCVFCHTSATKSPAAGIPSVEKCMGCHRVIATNTPAIQTLTGYWQRGEPVSWRRVNQLPRFVHFTHEVHVAAGFNCERCHGDVGHMNEAQPVVRMDMGWCLNCHSQQPNARQLEDCSICHY